MIKRILIVGLGSIGKRHLRNLRNLLPFADIRVLTNQSILNSNEFADGYFERMEQAINFLPQAAIIANPASFHIQTSLKLAQIGCHLFIEKPISIDSTGINELEIIAHKNKVIIQLGYNLRFNPSLTFFRDLIHNEKIGSLLTVKAEVGQYLPSWRSSIDYRNSVSAQKKLGGGVLLELSHEIDYLQWIFGEVSMVNAILCRQSDLDINVEDTAFITLKFVSEKNHNGLYASLYMDFIRHDSSRNCVVIGSEGTLRWNGISGTVELWEKGAKKWTVLFQQPPRENESYYSELQHFTDCIKNLITPQVSLNDGLSVIKVIETAHFSNKSEGISVPVDYFLKEK